MKIMSTTKFSDDQIRAIKANSHGIEILFPESRNEQLKYIPDVDIIVGSIGRELFLKAGKLKWVQTQSAGVDGMMFPEFINSDVILTSMKGRVGIHLADHAMALLLALIRGIHTAVRNPRWEMSGVIRENSIELQDRVMGIIGLGGTGMEVAKRAVAFGMKVIALEPEDVEKPEFVEEIWDLGRFYDLLECSDVVTICAPLTDETRGMFDLNAFRRMKKGGILINVTRGKIIDGEALMIALKEKLIAAAGLDVMPEEPLPSSSPLWNMENVIITPHTAGGTPARIDRLVELFCENLKRFLEGRQLLSVIDKRKGY